MRSFRLQLALLSGAFAAVLLLAAGAYAWRLTTSFNLDRLDRELRNIGAANLERVVGDEHWRRVESALRFVSGTDRPPGFALWVKNYDRELYRSPHWPTKIFPESLPRPTDLETGTAPSVRPPPPPRQGEPLSARNPPLPRRVPVFLTLPSDDHQWRVAVMGTPYTQLVVVANIDGFNADLTALRSAFFAALPFALLLVGGGAWFLAGRALRPVHVLTQAAERVTARGLDQRITTPGNVREFERLVTVFNEMLDRLEKGFHQANRFSADASHELKTPLALLQAELEQALASTPSGSPQQQLCTSLLDEVQRLKTITQKLLLLALADSGRLELHREPTDLTQLLANVIEDATAFAPHLAIEHAIPIRVSVLADAVLLEQALQNLTNNAIKYNRAEGLIRLTLRLEADSAIVAVGNTGPGISTDNRPHVFERFFRGDRSRARHAATGVGLGLSLSREIIRAHGGELALCPPRADGDWTEFVVRLPCTVAPAKPSSA
jgi:signal transduction histidine kinase